MRSRPLIFIVAGESSGDALGARLMKSLKLQMNDQVDFMGIGGPMMIGEGLSSLFPMEELSLMGLIEILPHLKQLRKRVIQAANEVNYNKPDMVLTIDSPGFSHAFIKRIKIKTKKVHYVAPSVWAWKPGRVHKFKKHYDHILALLPFEPPYFEKVKLPCHFVGHSILESGADLGDGPYFRKQHQISPMAKLLTVLPGSRAGEVKRLLPVFKEAVEKLSLEIEGLHCVIPTVSHLKETIIEETKNWNVPVLTIPSNDQKLKYDSMAAANVGLAASGTVALELALAKVPTVIAYKISPITHAMIRRFIKVDFGHLLNILAGKMIVPEYIQKDCTSQNLTSSLKLLFTENMGKSQILNLEEQLKKLSVNGTTPSVKAAETIIKILFH